MKINSKLVTQLNLSSHYPLKSRLGHQLYNFYSQHIGVADDFKFGIQTA